MLTIKALHDNNTKFILEIVKAFKGRAYIEPYNFDVPRLRKSMYRMQEDFGSKKFPLIIIEDENLDEVAAIWSESNPDWENEINKLLNVFN